MKLPICFRESVDVQQSVVAALSRPVGISRTQAFSIDATIDRYMGDMDSRRPEFPGHALAQHAQSRLRRRKVSEAWSPTKAGRCTCKDDRAAALTGHHIRGCLPHHASSETSHAPEILDLRCGEVAQSNTCVVAGVEHDQGNVAAANAFEHAKNFLLLRYISHNRLYRAA